MQSCLADAADPAAGHTNHLWMAIGEECATVKGPTAHLPPQLPVHPPHLSQDLAGVGRGMSTNPASQRQGSSLEEEWESDEEGSGNESPGEVPKTKGSWRGGEDDLLVR